MEIGDSVVILAGTRGASGVNVGGRKARVVDCMPSEREDYAGLVYLRFDDNRGRAEFFDWVQIERLRPNPS